MGFTTGTTGGNTIGGMGVLIICISPIDGGGVSYLPQFCANAGILTILSKITHSLIDHPVESKERSSQD